MALMDRIKVVSYLSMTYEEQIHKIKGIRFKRKVALHDELNKPKKVKRVIGKKKSTKRRAKKTTAASALKALQKLPPSAREALMKKLMGDK